MSKGSSTKVYLIWLPIQNNNNKKKWRQEQNVIKLM